LSSGEAPRGASEAARLPGFRAESAALRTLVRVEPGRSGRVELAAPSRGPCRPDDGEIPTTLEPRARAFHVKRGARESTASLHASLKPPPPRGSAPPWLRSISSAFPATSPSSWMATVAGRSPKATFGPSATARARTRCGASCERRAASGSKP